MAQRGPIKIAAEFPGSCLKWVHLAEPAFAQAHLDLDTYKISVLEQADSVLILLNTSALPSNSRGNTSTHPAYEVEINKASQKIIRANYIR